MLDGVVLAAEAGHAPNLWGALGCSVGFAGALLTTLDAFGDYVELRHGTPSLRLGQRLKYTGKLAGAGITVMSAGTVLALDSNWFALVTLSIVFTAIVVASWMVARRAQRQVLVPVVAEPRTAAPEAPPV